MIRQCRDVRPAQRPAANRKEYRLTWPMLGRYEVQLLEIGQQPLTLHLAPQEMALACAFIMNRGRVLARSDLIEAVWPDPDVEPSDAKGIVGQLIHRLRKKQIHVETHYGRGYRLP